MNSIRFEIASVASPPAMTVHTVCFSGTLELKGYDDFKCNFRHCDTVSQNNAINKDQNSNQYSGAGR